MVGYTAKRICWITVPLVRWTSESIPFAKQLKNLRHPRESRRSLLKVVPVVKALPFSIQNANKQCPRYHQIISNLHLWQQLAGILTTSKLTNLVNLAFWGTSLCSNNPKTSINRSEMIRKCCASHASASSQDMLDFTLESSWKVTHVFFDGNNVFF